MKSIEDRIELNNGYKIPCVGFGTYNASPEEAEEAVTAAIRAGYRHIDGAAFYGNETGVGAGIRNSGIPREEIFVTGKVWKADRGYDRTMAAFEKSLKDLGLEYLDLYLIHWPANYLVYGDDWKVVSCAKRIALDCSQMGLPIHESICSRNDDIRVGCSVVFRPAFDETIPESYSKFSCHVLDTCDGVAFGADSNFCGTVEAIPG